MFDVNSFAGRLRAPLATVSMLALCVAGMGQALAQSYAPGGTSVVKKTEENPASVSKKKPTSSSATVNLVNALVAQGVLKPDQAEALIKQAEDEAYVSREAAKGATTKADEAAKAASAAASAANPPGSRRVTYVPEVVKRELREDVRKEVMAKAEKEGWASPGKYPEWASRVRVYGDIRGRYEGQFFPGGYNSTGQIFDFNAINTGSPYDLSSGNSYYAPLLNTSKDRERYRLRARIGAEADLGDGFTTNIRLATGSDNSPVSTNQTLGGSGGNFSKYAVWLDRASITWEPFKHSRFAPYAGYDPLASLTGTGDGYYGYKDSAPERLSSVAITLGRFDNPFWSPTELVWDSDLGFDGASITARREIVPDFTPFLVAGAFPIFNTSLDFSSTQTTKYDSQDKYLFGAQTGLTWQATQTAGLTVGAGLFDFSNVQGRRSSACYIEETKDCDTDHLRPSFAQKGNTYIKLRNVQHSDATITTEPQYFGLASEYRPAVFAGRVDFGYFHPISILLDGEFVWNTAFDRKAMDTLVADGQVQNNLKNGRYDGGNIGWLTRLTVGHKKLEAFGDWNVNVGYKYLESDATLDAFVDSDFGLGGTNLKGYFVGGNFAFTKSVSASAKWMSADAVGGAPYAVDVVQVDLNAKF